MARKKTQAFTIGYADWSPIRLMREAENIARWNPWKAHEWMDEARNQLTLDSIWYDNYDETVDRINALWRSYTRHSWYEPRAFWSRNGVVHPPKQLEHLGQASQEFDLDTLLQKTLKI